MRSFFELPSISTKTTHDLYLRLINTRLQYKRQYIGALGNLLGTPQLHSPAPGELIIRSEGGPTITQFCRKNFFLVARPLRGGVGCKGRATKFAASLEAK